MILNQINEKLEEIDSLVFYGAVDNEVKESVWNYIVFNRGKLKPSSNKTGYTYSYDIHIVRENYIPEDLEIEVINKILEIEGMRLKDEEHEFNYIVKPNTNIVVEMLSLSFIKARKNA